MSIADRRSRRRQNAVAFHAETTIGRQGEHVTPILSRLVPSCGFLQQHCLREIIGGEQTRVIALMEDPAPKLSYLHNKFFLSVSPN